MTEQKVLTDDSPFPVPRCKFSGVKMCNVPAEYLLYLYNHEVPDGNIKDYIEDNYDLLVEQKKIEDHSWKDDRNELMKIKRAQESLL